MKNYVQRGDTITATAPSGGITSSDGMMMGTLFGVASTTEAEGEDVEIAVAGVFTLPVLTPETFAAGAKIYWDSGSKKCTTAQDSAGDLPLIGVAILAASTASVATVRLNGAAI